MIIFFSCSVLLSINKPNVKQTDEKHLTHKHFISHCMLRPSIHLLLLTENELYYLLVGNGIDVTQHERLSNITLRHKLE
jgi:hypothetical protein